MLLLRALRAVVRTQQILIRTCANSVTVETHRIADQERKDRNSGVRLMDSRILADTACRRTRQAGPDIALSSTVERALQSEREQLVTFAAIIAHCAACSITRFAWLTFRAVANV